jgi:glyoxylase-like metal-dependent hydrolase (beta-lactamase superfamily II)
MSTATTHRAIGSLLTVGLVAGTAALAEHQTPYDQINQEAARTDVAVTRIRDNVSQLAGSGGNITVLVAPQGLVMVDAGIALSREKLAARLRALSPAPVLQVINTHWHWDHADGNGWLHSGGATLVAHPNTIRHLGETIRVAEWEHTFTPVPEKDRPTVAVAQQRRTDVGGEPVEIRTYGGAAHTDGDLAVYFPREDVLATGDTWWNGQYPFIDYVAGGSIDGMIRAANQNIAWATDQTRVVPGHGPAGGRAELVEYRDMLVDVRARVAKLKAQGRTLQEVLAAKPTAAYDAKWGKSVVSPELFTTLVYRGV